MSQFDDRKKGEEARYAFDQETQFKISVRRNKLLGLWAAERMGLTGAPADAYAKTVVLSDLEEAGDDDVLRKVAADLDKAGKSATEAELRTRMAELLPEARRMIMEETKK
jgi:hypothetical protein